MKEVWKEITESIEMKIALVALLSILTLVLLAGFLVAALSHEKAEEYQHVTDISHPYFNSIQTNFTQ